MLKWLRIRTPIEQAAFEVQVMTVCVALTAFVAGLLVRGIL